MQAGTQFFKNLNFWYRKDKIYKNFLKFIY